MLFLCRLGLAKLLFPLLTLLLVLRLHQRKLFFLQLKLSRLDSAKLCCRGALGLLILSTLLLCLCPFLTAHLVGRRMLFGGDLQKIFESEHNTARGKPDQKDKENKYKGYEDEGKAHASQKLGKGISQKAADSTAALERLSLFKAFRDIEGERASLTSEEKSVQESGQRKHKEEAVQILRKQLLVLDRLIPTDRKDRQHDGHEERAVSKKTAQRISDKSARRSHERRGISHLKAVDQHKAKQKENGKDHQKIRHHLMEHHLVAGGFLKGIHTLALGLTLLARFLLCAAIFLLFLGSLRLRLFLGRVLVRRTVLRRPLLALKRGCLRILFLVGLFCHSVLRVYPAQCANLSIPIQSTLYHFFTPFAREKHNLFS